MTLNEMQMRARRALQMMGKCASLQHTDGHLCTLTANHTDCDHMAQVLGGIDDGKVLAQWPW
jgi:hypothetical protein